jgi:hypothetical protein
MHDVFGDSSRREMVVTIGLAVLCAGFSLVIYYTAPLVPRAHGAIWWRLTVAMALFTAVTSQQLQAIVRNARPMRRAVVALAVVLPLFVVVFSWLYLVVSRSTPAAFGIKMSRTTALYFTVTVLSTVGFGDITPKTDPARLLVSAQMVMDLILIAVVVKLILGTASRALQRSEGPTTP